MKNKFLIFSALTLTQSSMAQANISSPCPNEYVKPNENNKMTSYLYVIQVDRSFTPKSIDLVSYYNKLSSEKKPTYQCEFTTPAPGNYATNYNEGLCINIQTNKTFSVYGGDGIEISDDGNITSAGGCFDSGGYCSFIEDGNGSRIIIRGDNLTRRNYMITWNRNFSDNYMIISECASGKIDTLNVFKAFPGYAIIQRSIETGFVDTYQRKPEIKF